MYSGYCQMFVNVLGKGPVVRPMGPTSGAVPSGAARHRLRRPSRCGACWATRTAISVGNGQMITTTGSTIQKMGITKYLGMGSWLGWKYPNLKP